MTLRRRLLLTTLAVAVPLTAALFYIAERSRQADMMDSANRYLSAELAAGLIDRCESEGGLRRIASDAERGGRVGGRGVRAGRGGPRPAPGGTPGPVDLIAYTRTFGSAHLGPAPPFPDELKPGLASTDRVSGVFVTTQGRGVQLAVRLTETSGPCDILLIRVRARAGEIRDQVIGLSSILFIVVAAIWMATGPTIARIRGLADHVRVSAASHYAVPVPDTGQDEVAALARAFNEAGQDVLTHVTAVEARETTLREFVANTNHDIAVPLTVLQSHLASLEVSATSEGDAEHVRGAMREAHYMSSLLRNLATASRLEGGVATQSMALDLNLVVDRVVARHSPVARAAGVEINFAVPATETLVEADPTLVEQAVSNLVDNAVRYNRIGGHVAVVLDRSAAHANRFQLIVEDDGHGVSADELPKLATRRFRGDAARSRRPVGEGIGLAIAAEAIERLGWSLAFRMNSPRGLVAEISGVLAQRQSQNA